MWGGRERDPESLTAVPSRALSQFHFTAAAYLIPSTYDVDYQLLGENGRNRKSTMGTVLLRERKKFEAI
jgi:hypothetical protein